jgi:hypothetical protein
LGKFKKLIILSFSSGTKAKDEKNGTEAELPDGFFSNQKSKFGEIFEGPNLENVVIFYGHLEYGIFYDHLVHYVLIWYIFSGFGIMYQEKSGNHGKKTNNKVEKQRLGATEASY